MSIQATRSTYNATGRRLRRARHLYVRLVRKAIENDKTNAALYRCAQQMLRGGLYNAATPIRETRYRILREMCRQDDWHRWLLRNGFAVYAWSRQGAKEAA